MTIQVPQPEMVSVSELKVDGDNPNRMTERQLERLKSSIEKYGFIIPIITNKDLLIADGEQRLTVAQKLGMKEVSVVRLPVEDVDRRLLRQVLNKLRGEHDLIADALEFEKIIGMGNEDELKHLLDLSDAKIDKYLQSLISGDVESWNMPKDIANLETTITQGDVFQLGENRLMCGDSTNPKNVQTLMDAQLANMIFTDPPYGIDFLPQGKGDLYKLGKLQGDGDFKHNPQQFTISRDALPNLIQYIKNGAPFYICSGWSQLEVIVPTLRSLNCLVNSVLVWDRLNPRMLPRPQDYLPVNEFIVYGWKKGTKKYYRGAGSQQTTIWRFKTLKAEEMHHITEKPLELAENGILQSCPINGLVLDGFAGSGSTLIAAIKNECRCYMMEIDPRYCQVIIDRWEAYTGQKAQKIV